MYHGISVSLLLPLLAVASPAAMQVTAAQLAQNGSIGVSGCGNGIDPLTCRYCGPNPLNNHIQCSTQYAHFDNLDVNTQPGIYMESSFQGFTVGTPPVTPNTLAKQANLNAFSPLNFVVTPRFTTAKLQFSSVEQIGTWPYGTLKSFMFACATPGADPTTGLQAPHPCQVTVSAKCLPAGKTGVASDGFVHYSSNFPYVPPTDKAVLKAPMAMANWTQAAKPATAASYCVEYTFAATSTHQTDSVNGTRMIVDDVIYNLFYPV